MTTTTNTNLPAWAIGLDLTASRKLEQLVATTVRKLPVVEGRMERSERVRLEVRRRWFGR